MRDCAESRFCASGAFARDVATWERACGPGSAVTELRLFRYRSSGSDGDDWGLCMALGLALALRR